MTDTLPSAKLTDFVELSALQELQNAFGQLTGVAISIRDAEGQPITRTCGESDFCLRFLENPPSAAACHDSHAAVAAEACRTGQPCQHDCHAGLLQHATPIVLDGRRIAAIVVGDRPRTPLTDDRVGELARNFGFDEDALRRAAWALPNWSDRDVAAAMRFAGTLADTLASLCHHAQQLQFRIEELAAVYRVSTLLAGERDLKEVLNLSARLVADVFRVKAAGIRLLDDDTGELRIVAVHNLSNAYLAKGPLLAANSPIDSEALAGNVVYVADMPADPRTVYKDEARAEGIHSGLVARLAYRGKAIGVMRVYSGEYREFSSYEVSLLKAVAEQCAAAIIHARMRQEAKEAEALERQVHLAGDVQRRMIPANPPAHPRLDIGCVYRPSFDLGGDFFDFLEFPAGNLGIAIADVAGKGVPASLSMASVRAALRAHAKNIYDIDRIMAELNRNLCRDTLQREFVTLFYGVISHQARRFTFCNAGHEPVILLRKGQAQRLDYGGLVLGVEAAARYERGMIELAAGDVLLFLTDGLIEAMDYEDHVYGRERLVESLRRHADLDAPQLAKQLLWDVRRFAGLAKQSDDLTLVVVKVK